MLQIWILHYYKLGEIIDGKKLFPSHCHDSAAPELAAFIKITYWSSNILNNQNQLFYVVLSNLKEQEHIYIYRDSIHLNFHWYDPKYKVVNIHPRSIKKKQQQQNNLENQAFTVTGKKKQNNNTQKNIKIREYIFIFLHIKKKLEEVWVPFAWSATLFKELIKEFFSASSYLWAEMQEDII